VSRKLDTYRSSSAEQLRAEDIFQLLPRDRKTILEIGTRDGYHTRKLTEIFETVTALDLNKPGIEIPRVTAVEGDVTHLSFPDRSFDCVLCAEVLEHIPNVERAAREIARVARHEVLIGVPYKQDRRVGRLTCTSCGKINPPFGHVHSFDEQVVKRLFCDFEATAIHFVGMSREQTNVFSTLLLDLAGNPWGTYGQDETCLQCGAVMQPPSVRSLPQKVASRLAHVLNRFQEPFVKDHANWIHLLFRRTR
jgi:ubiquinone/menaquinone biosynthesis C-methylase UbiE